MKTARKIAKNKFFTTIMSLLVLFVTTYNVDASETQLNFDKDISGEQMFREIFFFQGGNMHQNLPKAVQAEYNMINNLTAEQEKTRVNLINNVVSLINKNNPSYFKTLKNAIHSKNQYKVKEVLANGGELIMNALSLQEESKKLSEYLGDRKVDLNDREEVKKLVEELELQSDKMASNDGKRVEEFACIAFAFALVIAVAIAGVAVVVSVIVEVINYAAIADEKGSALKSDQYINGIILSYS